MSVEATHPAESVSEYWKRIADRWRLVGPPLRPSEEDAVHFNAAIRRAQPQGRRLEGLILGVTPELYRLDWPVGARVQAVDGTPEMIAAVWPGPPEDAHCGDWTQMPLEDASCDIALMDGGFSMVPYPSVSRALVQSIHRVLAPNGLCAVRLFVPPPVAESSKDIVDDLINGRISSLNVCKLRLWMALQPSYEEGLEIGKVWQAIYDACPDWELLAKKAGWTLEHLMAIEAYRERPARYHFVDVATVQGLFCIDPGGFETLNMVYPAYERGEQCPIVTFKRKA